MCLAVWFLFVIFRGGGSWFVMNTFVYILFTSLSSVLKGESVVLETKQHIKRSHLYRGGGAAFGEN